MPFITTSTGLEISHEDPSNPNQPPLNLTNLGTVGLDETAKEFKRDIYQGKLHDTYKTAWSSPPILRVQTEKFTDADWDRFYAWFIKQRNIGIPSVHFQPELYDIEDEEFWGAREIPKRILEQLDRDGILDACLTEIRVLDTRGTKKADEVILKRYREKINKVYSEEKPKSEEKQRIREKPKSEEKQEVNA